MCVGVRRKLSAVAVETRLLCNSARQHVTECLRSLSHVTTTIVIQHLEDIPVKVRRSESVRHRANFAV